MNELVTRYKREFRQKVVHVLWSQWSSLGVYGSAVTTKKTGYVFDPDALLLFSLPFARYDARLWDEILDWLSRHGYLINVQRVKTLARTYALGDMRFLAPVATQLSSNVTYTAKWRSLATFTRNIHEEPLFYDDDEKSLPVVGPTDPIYKAGGFLRSPVSLRGMSKALSKTDNASMLLRMRALFGVSLRAELLCALSAADSLYASEAARLIEYDKKSVQSACADLVASGYVGIQPVEGREKRYYVRQPLASTLATDTSRPIWLRWGPLYRALELYCATLSSLETVTEPTIVASELRKTVQTLAPYIALAGLSYPFSPREELRGYEYLSEIHTTMQILCDMLS